MGEIPAEYELRPEEPSPVKPASMTTILIAIGVLVALAAGIIALLLAAHGDSTASQQTTQIRNLDKANVRLAGEIASQGNQLSAMTAKLAASDPSSDSSLITCHDLRGMGLRATTGGSVSAVPGAVSLNQPAVPLPAHCRK